MIGIWSSASPPERHDGDVTTEMPIRTYVVRPGHLARFICAFGAVGYTFAFFLGPVFIAQGAGVLGGLYWMGFALFADSLMFAVIRTKSTIGADGTTVVRNWYRTRTIQPDQIERVEVGKGFLSPLHRAIHLHLTDSADIRVFATDRMLNDRRQLPAIRDRFETAARS